MIEKKNLGKTEYGGEIYYLKADDPFSIPAVRAYVSTHITKRNVFTKRVRDTEEVIKYFSDNPQKAKKYIQHIIGFGHEDMGEGGYTGIYFKNFSRLFTFISWMPIRSWEKIYGVGTEMSLRYVTLKEDPFIEIEDRRIKDLNEEAFELYKLMIANKVPKEDARYIMPLSTKTEKIIQIPEGRMIRKLVNYLYSSEFEEVSQALDKLKLMYASSKTISKYDVIMLRGLRAYEAGLDLIESAKEDVLARIAYLPSKIFEELIERLREIKQSRDQARVETVLKNLEKEAKKVVDGKKEVNLMYAILDAVKAYATLGEISDTLRDVFGEYKPPIII